MGVCKKISTEKNQEEEEDEEMSHRMVFFHVPNPPPPPLTPLQIAQNNARRRWRLLRMCTRLLTLYRRLLERHYAPDGDGATRAAEEFEQGAKRQKREVDNVAG